MIARLPLALLILPATTLAYAAPLVPAHVPADAKWVCHLNMDAVRKGSVGQMWRSHMENNERYTRKIKEMSDKLGMNPTKDLLGVTVYDTGYQRHKGVVLMHLKKVNKDKLMAAFQAKHPDHTTSKHGQRTLYTWKDHRDHEVTGCFANDVTILMSSDAKRVKAALAVIDGDKPSLSDAADLLQDWNSKAMLAARAIDVAADYKKVTRCPVLRVSQAATFAAAQKKDNLTVRYHLVADSEEIARQCKAVVDGFKAMVMLRFGSDESVAGMANQLKTKVKGSDVTVTWKGSITDLAAAAERAHKRRGDNRHHKGQRADDDDEDDDDDDDDDDDEDDDE